MKRFFLLHLLSNVWRSEFNNSDIAVSKDAHTDYWNELLEGEVALKFFYFSFVRSYSDTRDGIRYDFEKVFLLRSKQRWNNEGQEDLFCRGKERERLDSVEREEETKFLGQDCRRIQGTRQGYPRTTRCNLMTLIAIVKTNDERGNPVKLEDSNSQFDTPLLQLYFPFEEKTIVYAFVIRS